MTIQISRTELARNTRKAIEQARRNGPVMVESYGEEQVAILDAIDYRLLQAVVHFQSRDPGDDSFSAPQGLTEDQLQQFVAEAGDNIQVLWDRVITAHQNHDISFGRAAELLHVNRFELTDRFNRLGIPIHMGPATMEEAWREIEALQK